MLQSSPRTVSSPRRPPPTSFSSRWEGFHSDRSPRENCSVTGAVLVRVLPWLEGLFSQNASIIESQELSLTILNSLHQIIQSRISTLESALQLKTCLDVLSVQIPDNEDVSAVATIIYEDRDSDEEDDDEDAMDTEEEEEEEQQLGAFIDSPQDSDGSEVMSD